MTAYKMMRMRKGGTLGSLYIDPATVRPIGKWLTAEPHFKKGYKYRPGFHCLPQPVAPHLKLKDDRVWVEVDIDSYTIFDRPEHQGGEWFLANRMKINRIMEELTC